MTDTPDNTVSRRGALAAGGLGAVALAGLARSAAAESHERSATEKANVAMVGEFMKLWSAPDCTAEKLAAFIAEDCILRMEENKPAVEGKAAAIDAFNVFLKDGQRFGIDTLDTFAIGPIVANSRSDYVIVPGKEPTGRFAVAGVFIVRDGKIQEWSDYLVPKS